MSQTGTIGIVGGGQLGRMLTEAALPLGFKVVVLDANKDCPASQVGAKQIVGDLYDAESLKKLAEEADFITIEIEHIDASVLDELAKNGKPVNPSPKTIALIQDKYKQKIFLQEAGIPTADFIKLDGQKSIEKAQKKFGDNMLLKSRLGAYDGRGNMVVSSAEGVDKMLKAIGGKFYVEKFVPFKKELAVMVARDFRGKMKAYPVTETIHERSICIETFTPADIDLKLAEQATEFAKNVVKHLDGAGVFGVEMFLTNDNKILVNEIAPRVHNSGHYTIEGCETSQFEQHIRAITGMELDSTDLKVPAAVMVNILGERDGPTDVKGLAEASAVPGVAVHLYGKSPTKVDRKMGHITATGATMQEARERAEQARKLIDV